MTYEPIRWHARWRLEKYRVRDVLAARVGPTPYEVREGAGNLLVTVGLQRVLDLMIGAGGMSYANANAHIGVGNSSATAEASQIDLQGASKTRRPMDANYPSRSGAIVSFRSTFGTGDANYAWNEWAVFNAASGGQMLNRKVENFGTKTSADIWVLTVTVSLSNATVAPSVQYPPDTTLSYVNVNNDPRPAYLAEITDSTWGTKIRRITNVHLRRNSYPKRQDWNKDGTLLFLGYGFRMLNGVTYGDIGQRATGVQYPVWSNVDPDKMYGCSDNQPYLKRYSYATNAWTNIITFANVAHVDLGNFEGNISDDDTRIALRYRDSGGTWGVIVANPVTGVEVARLPIGTTAPDNCGVSRSGAFTYIVHGSIGTGTFQGTRLYNSSDLSSVRQIMSGQTHGDMGKNAAGEDVYVSSNGSHRCSDGQVTTILPGGYAFGHVSCANYDRPGWAYMSAREGSAGSPGTVGYGQIFAVKLDGSQTVEVFGFHHNGTEPMYEATPFATPNRDGSKVLFGGAWGGDPNTQIFSFVAGMTT